MYTYMYMYTCVFANIHEAKTPRVQKRRGQEEPATKSSDINYGQELCEQIRDLKL